MAGTIDIKPATKLRLALDVPAGKQPVFNMISTRWHFQRFDMVLRILPDLYKSVMAFHVSQFHFFSEIKKFVKIMRMYEKKYNKNDKDC